MTAVLWVLAVPSLAFGGLAYGTLARLVRRRRPHPDPHHLRPRHGRRPRRRPGHLRRLAAHHGARPPASRSARSPPTPRRDAGLVEAEAIATHAPAYGDVASAPDPADPGRLLLGPLHRHAAAGFHLDAVYTALFVRPVQAARHASSGSSTARSSTPTYAARAPLPRWLGTAVRRAQTGNVQTYVSALLAGSVVLAVAAAPRRQREREQA